MKTETISLQIGEVRMHPPRDVIVRIILEYLTPNQATPRSADAHSTPRIGDLWRGGIYAGIAAGENWEPDGHIILLDPAPKEMKWKDAMAWAEGIGAHLPTRTESALLYANLRDKYENNGWHWTSTESQSSANRAFGQSFSGGNQYTGYKDYGYLVRPVRRFSTLII